MGRVKEILTAFKEFFNPDNFYFKIQTTSTGKKIIFWRLGGLHHVWLPGWRSYIILSIYTLLLITMVFLIWNFFSFS